MKTLITKVLDKKFTNSFSPFVILFLCLSICCNDVHGQIMLGARAGVGFPAIINQNNYGQSELDYVISAKPMGSVFLGYNLENDNEIQLRLAYRSQGQKYKGTAQTTTYEREIKMNNIELIGIYRLDFASPFNVTDKLYFMLGPRLNFVLSVDQEFKINDQSTDFLTYVNDRKNPNEAEILALGAPDDDKEFFTDYDLGLFGGVGYESMIHEQLYWNVEFVGSVGITDINQFRWKLPNREKSIYEASYNFIGGINIGVTYYLEKRRVPRI
jgi:hypothetical protein